MSSVLLAYVSNDNTLQVDGLKDDDDEYINDATVSCTGIYTEAGAVVSGDSFPKTLTYVTGSDGRYRATLEQVLALVDGETYYAVITVTGGGLHAEFRPLFVARTRRAL
jgi:hypothetical protein